MEREPVDQISVYLDLNRRLRKEPIAPGVCRLGYVVSETIDNQPATLIRTKELLKAGIIKKALIADPMPQFSPGYPGAEYLRQVFEETGVKDYESIVTDSDTPVSWNTQSEMATLAQYLKKTEDKNVLLIVPWFHSLRSYITAVSEFKNANLETRVFVSSVEMDPFETVTHSQGIQKDSRRKIFYEELRKCGRYKNLIPVDEALKTYKRDRGLLYI